MTAFTSKPRLSLHKESELLPKTQKNLLVTMEAQKITNNDYNIVKENLNTLNEMQSVTPQTGSK